MEPLSVWITHHGAWIGIVAMPLALAWLGDRVEGAFPSYLAAWISSVACVVLLRTPAQKLAIACLPMVAGGIALGRAAADPIVYAPGLFTLLLPLALAAIGWSTLHVALAVAVAVAGVVVVYLRDVQSGASAAVGLNPERALAAQVLTLVAGGMIFARMGAYTRRERARRREETERAVAELRRRQETELRLVRAQRLEAVGRLAGGLAHDFNNLLTAVAANLEAIRTRGAEPVAPEVRSALHAVRRGARLTRQLLSYVQRDTFHAVAVDVEAVLTSMMDLLQRALGETVVATIEIGPDVPPCIADAGQIEAAILNLAVNARDAMPGGGTIAIEVRRVAVGPGDYGGRLSAGTYVRIAVSDDGAGMEPETLARATEPFFTTKEKGRGTGLGLAMVEAFVCRSKGHMEIESHPGRGTKVTLLLPAAEGVDVSRDEAGATKLASQWGGSRRVLLVEDDPDVREATVALLDAMGFRVLPAKDADVALKMFDRHRPDLVFSDVVLPGRRSGVDLARAIQERDPAIPILLASGYTADELEGVDGFEVLEKPFRARELRQRLQMVLGETAADDGDRGPRASLSNGD